MTPRDLLKSLERGQRIRVNGTSWHVEYAYPTVALLHRSHGKTEGELGVIVRGGIDALEYAYLTGGGGKTVMEIDPGDVTITGKVQR